MSTRKVSNSFIGKRINSASNINQKLNHNVTLNTEISDISSIKSVNTSKYGFIDLNYKLF
jgi:hypothetical protein